MGYNVPYVMADNSATMADAADVLDRIETELGDDTKVELSDDDMAALGIWTDDTAGRHPAIATQKDADPVAWKLYDISDVDGRDLGEYLALEVHDKQQGPRYTRPYAVGLGRIQFEATGLPIAEEMQADVNEVAERRGVDPVDEPAMTRVRREMAEAAEEYADIALEGNAWAAAYDGRRLYVEPEVSRWEDFGRAFDGAELSEWQREAVREAAPEWSYRPRHLDGGQLSYAVYVSFE
jgi:hypothetical protein